MADALHLWEYLPRLMDTLKQTHATKAITPLLSDPQGVTLINELARKNGAFDPMRQLQLAAILRAQQAAQEAAQPGQ